jgi:hypothetical protein
VPFWDRSAPVRAQLEAELERAVGSADAGHPIRVDKLKSGSGAHPTVRLLGQAWLDDEGRIAAIGWEGDIPTALGVLQELPDGAGAATLWAGFHPDLPEVKLWAGLDRVGVGEYKVAQGVGTDCVDLQVLGDGGVYLSELLGANEVEEVDLGGRYTAVVGGTVGRVWLGKVEDAVARVSAFPSNARTQPFWAAFPDTE